MVKSTDFSSKGPRFNLQYPHGSSQPTPALVPGLDTLLWLLRAMNTHGAQTNVVDILSSRPAT